MIVAATHFINSIIENNIKVLYLRNRSKKNNKGLVPIFLRITYNNLRVHKSTGFYTKAENWDVKNQRIKGSTMEIHAKNSQLDSYATFIDELMISNVRDLKEKLSINEKRTENDHIQMKNELQDSLVVF